MADIEEVILPKQKVVCILGMHRSGTSMITRVINLMGVYLGKTENMMAADENINAAGFWEHTEIVKIHEEILKELNSSWKSTMPLPDNWWELASIKKYKDKLIGLIKNEFSNVSIWGFKDPRTCILLPLWKEIFKNLDIEPMFVISLRNPIDIANSLIKRDSFSLNYSVRLWYYYMINILEETESFNRIFIEYDEMIENGDLNLIKLMKFLDINVSEENKKDIRNTLMPNLRHSKTKQSELKLLGNEQAIQLYNICQKLIENAHCKMDLKLYSYEKYILNENKRSDMYITSLYIDYGIGYSEETSIKQIVKIKENGEFTLQFDLGLKGESIKNFRWDPLEGIYCKCTVENILVNNVFVNIDNTNADYSNEKQFDFLTIDPMCFWENNCKVVETVSICGKINFYEPSQLQRFLHAEKLKVTAITERLKCNENENKLLIKDRDEINNKNKLLNEDIGRIINENKLLNEDMGRIINENELIIKDREQIILENENKRLAREKEVMNTINELENRYKILLINKTKLDKEYQLVLNSPSWRITKPLRYIKRILFKLIRK